MSKSKFDFHSNLAVIIGINNYSNGIPELETPVADAEELAKILQENYQYEVQILLNEKATLKELNALLDGFKQKTLHLPDKTVQIEKNDRLIFYFAGHGIVPADGLENTDNLGGYLVPQDARGDILLQKQIEIDKILLPMLYLHDALSELPCRHLLVILDCCFAGAFRSSLYREIVPARKVYKQRYIRFIRDPAWQAIASAAHDQKAIDYLGCFGERGTIEDNKHSPFAEALFEGLRGAADTTPREGDGIITATELYCYVRDRVEVLTDEQNRRQTPGLFPLKKHDKGEYIFLLPSFDQDKLEDVPALNEENNPYRGLKSYEEEHSPLFFGRDELVKQLYTRICQPENPLTVVLGVSGSGKSSLVKAGLIPYLRTNHPEQWHIISTLRPGESPFAALAEAIVENSETSGSKIDAINSLSETLKQAPRQFIAVMANWRQIPANTRLLLVIDQFEELITTCKQQERERFLNFLAEALAAHSQQLCLVLTLRSDFEPRFLNSALKSYWINARFPVRPMRSDELRQAIERPALEKMLDFEPPELVSYLIDEVGQMPGALSLLSFTLSELYIKCIESDRGNRSLTEADYKDLGGVAGSLTHRATEVYNKLDKAQQITIQRVMLRMVTIEGGELARRRVPLSELEYIDDIENERVQEIRQRLDKARLIIGGRETGGEPYVEPAHDALVRGWNKLQEWINQEQENLLLQQRLTPAANDWHINNRPNGLLLPDGDRLNQLEKILQQDNNWLNKREREFVQKSIESRESKNAIAEAGRLATESARLSDKPQLSSLLASEAIFATVRAGVPPDVRAEQALRDSLNQLGGQGLGHFDSEIAAISFNHKGNALVALMIDGGLYMWQTPEGNEWLGHLWKTGGIEKVERLFIGETSIWGLSPRYVINWTEDGVLSTHELPQMLEYEEDDPNGLDYHLGKKRAWRSSATLGRLEGFNLQGPFEQPEIRLTIDDAGFNHSIFEPRMNWFFVESFNGDTYLTALSADEPAQSVLHLTDSSESPIEVARFDASGKTLAVGHTDGTIDMWRLSDKRTRPSMTVKVPQTPEVLSFAEHRPWLVVVFDDPEDDKQTIVLLDFSESPVVEFELPPVAFELSNGAAELQFSDDDRWLVISDGLRAAVLLDLREGLDKIRLDVLHRHPSQEDVGSVVPAPVKFSPDSRWLATVSDDNQAHLWFLESEFPRANHLSLNGHDGAVFSLAFDDDGRWLVTGSYDNTLRSWDLQRLNTSTWPLNLREASKDRIVYRPFSSPLNPEGGIELVRFNSSGDRIMVWGEHNKRQLWRIRDSERMELEQQFDQAFPFMSNTGRWLLIRENGIDDVLIDLESKTELQQHSLTIESSDCTFSEGDEYLICGDNSGNSTVWKLSDPPQIVDKELHATDEEINGVYITPDGRYSVVVAASIILWQQRDATGTVVESEIINLDDIDDVFGWVELSYDGQTCLIGSTRILVRSDGHWRTTDMRDGPGHSAKLGPGLFFHTTDEFTEILDINADGNWRRHDLTETVGYAYAEKYDTDSGLLAVSGETGEVFVFKERGQEFKLQTRLPGGGIDVTAIAVSSATMMATGERDGTVRLWRRRMNDNGYDSLILGRHQGGVNYLEFSPDGQWLVSGGEDNDVLVYPMSLERLLKSAKTAIGRGFTDAERKSAFPHSTP